MPGQLATQSRGCSGVPLCSKTRARGVCEGERVCTRAHLCTSITQWLLWSESVDTTSPNTYCALALASENRGCGLPGGQFQPCSWF